VIRRPLLRIRRNNALSTSQVLHHTITNQPISSSLHRTPFLSTSPGAESRGIRIHVAVDGPTRQNPRYPYLHIGHVLRVAVKESHSIHGAVVNDGGGFFSGQSGQCGFSGAGETAVMLSYSRSVVSSFVVVAHSASNRLAEAPFYERAELIRWVV